MILKAMRPRHVERGEARATAHANRLQRQTGTRHRAVPFLFTDFDGAAPWWTVQKRCLLLFWRHVASYGTTHGARL